MSSLFICILTYDASQHTVYWPYSIRAYGFGRIAPLLQAIDRPSPAVTFYVQSEFHTMSDLRNLLMSKGVARIVVMTSQPSYRTVPATAILMEQVDADPELSGKVELESAQEIQYVHISRSLSPTC